MHARSTIDATTASRRRAVPVRRALIGAGLGLALIATSADAKTKVGTPGPDRLKAGPSGDLLWGGGGADTLIGGAGNDVMYGVRSNNKIDGKGGNNYIEGGAGSDSIKAGNGANTIFGSSGHDVITVGDGNNYVDVGGAPDAATLGNGNNVLHTGSGGGQFKLGSGNNTVYYGSGPANISMGGGVNNIYLSGTAAIRTLHCGGNPATVVYVNDAALAGKPYALRSLGRKMKGCPTVTTYDGNKRILAKQAGKWQVGFDLIGGDGRDKLFGGHGGGTIEGGEGDNEIWADFNEDTGLPQSQQYTTRIRTGNGHNRIFGGRGTNVITAGNGNNFVRAGAHVNDITVGSGDNLIRLQGAASTNTITIRGRGAGAGTFVESLANGKKPVIRCEDGARAVIVYGNTKPQTNCGTNKPIRSKSGQVLAVERTPGVPASDPIVEPTLLPGENGIGVPRPVTG